MVEKSFFSLTFGFILSILLSQVYPFSFGVIGFILILVTLFLCAYFYSGHRGTHVLLACLLIGFSLGSIRTSWIDTSLPKEIVPLIGTTTSLSGIIVSESDIRETTQRVTIEVQEGHEKIRLLAVLPLFPEVTYGETIRIKGKVEQPDAFETNGGRTFHYDTYLSKDGIRAVVRDAYVEHISKREGVVAITIGVLFDAKHAFLSALSQSLPEPEASLAAGLLAGGKQGLGQTLLNAFIVSGLVHIVVLSGYNIMIVAEAARKLFSFFPKIIANSIASGVVFFFVLMSGAGSASVRAGLMAGIGLFARATNRTYDAFRALLVAGICMLLLNPLLLVYDPGFQLSFVATLGLIFGSPLFEKWFHWMKYKVLREVCATTCAAQLAVLPLLLYQTGVLSFVALPANIIVLPLVPLAMATAAFAAVGSLGIPMLASLFGLPAFFVLLSIRTTTEFFAALPFASVTLPAFSPTLLFIVYGILLYSWWRVTRKSFSPQQHPS